MPEIHFHGFPQKIHAFREGVHSAGDLSPASLDSWFPCRKRERALRGRGRADGLQCDHPQESLTTA